MDITEWNKIRIMLNWSLRLRCISYTFWWSISAEMDSWKESVRKNTQILVAYLPVAIG